MKKYIYESPQQLRDELRELEGKSGIYIIRFTNKDRYVGQSIDLFRRLREHIGNMETGQNGNLRDDYGIERFLFNSGYRYTITIYECDAADLRLYEEYLSWETGGFGKTSRQARQSKVEYPVFRPTDFEYITPMDWHYFLHSVDNTDKYE